MQQQPEYKEYPTEKIQFLCDKLIDCQVKQFIEIANEINSEPDTLKWIEELIDYFEYLKDPLHLKARDLFLNTYNSLLKVKLQEGLTGFNRLLDIPLGYDDDINDNNKDSEFLTILSRIARPIHYALGHLSLKDVWNNQIADEIHNKLIDEANIELPAVVSSPSNFVLSIISNSTDNSENYKRVDVLELLQKIITIFKTVAVSEDFGDFFFRGLSTAANVIDTVLYILAMKNPNLSSKELFKLAQNPHYFHNFILLAREHKDFIYLFRRPFGPGRSPTQNKLHAEVFIDSFDNESLTLDIDAIKETLDYDVSGELTAPLQYCIALASGFTDPMTGKENISLISIFFLLIMHFAKKEIWRKNDNTLGNYFDVIKEKILT